MDNKKSNTLMLASISTIVSSIIFLWFTFRPGLIGTFHWHLEILAAYLGLLATVLLPAIFVIIYLIIDRKGTRRLSKFFSIFTMTLWCLIFAGLTVLANLPVDKKGLYQLNQTDTLPIAKKHYAVTSDPHWGSGGANAEARSTILKNVDSRDYDAMFVLGDISEVGMITSIYQSAVDDIKANVKKTPVLLMPGNHDGIVNGIPAFKKTFMNKGDKMYYRLDNDNIHMIFLYILWDDAEFSKDQEKWLIEQLESIPQEDTVIVYSHCYVLGSGYYDTAAKKNWGDIPGVVNKLCPIFEKYNVDLVLTGHNHFFEALEKDGVDYMVLGSMGGKLDTDLVYNSPYSKWLNNTDYGWLDMKINDSTIDLTVYTYQNKPIYTKTISTK